MIINSALSSANSYSYGIPSTGLLHSEHSSTGQTTVLVVGEYFVSASKPTAKSNIDYLQSPIQQIQSRLNEWLASLGSDTRLQCEDSALVMAPASKISPEFFEGYEPFFKTIFLYQARLGAPDMEDLTPPSEAQMNVAFLGLANLMAAFVPAPAPMLLEDGTIGGYWRHGRCYASIDFEVDGEHTWVETDGEEFKSGTWKLPGQPVPPALVQELFALAS
ncbi:MAG: hypothetical protein IPN53_08450 [Comamonadaceae bacterium]|nr:hypothetical protein [Comamonadaceae bacterium]